MVDSVKTEKLRTDLPNLHVIHCDSCLENTPHKVLASHETETKFTEKREASDQPYIFEITYDWMQIVRCEKCEAVTFRKLESFTGFPVENSEGVWVDRVYETRLRGTKTIRRLMDVEESTIVFE